MGINERDRKYGGRQYNSALYISNRGEILGAHRKINITVQELFIHTRGDGGENLQVHEMDFGRISGLICGEHHQPMLKQCYIVQGTKVNCSLWPGCLGGGEELPWVAPALTTAMAASGACWCVLAANYIPPEKRPTDFYSNTDFHQSFGGSAIINPFGEVVAGPVRDEETIVYADIDLKVNEMARGIVNITGIYSRWDILGLQVRQPVRAIGVHGVGGGRVGRGAFPADGASPAGGALRESRPPGRRCHAERGGRTEGPGDRTGETPSRGTRPLGSSRPRTWLGAAGTGALRKRAKSAVPARESSRRSA